MSKLNKKLAEYQKAEKEGQDFLKRVKEEAQEIEAQIEKEQVIYDNKVGSYNIDEATKQKRKIRDLEDDLQIKQDFLEQGKPHNNPKLLELMNDMLQLVQEHKQELKTEGSKIEEKLEEHQKQTVKLMSELEALNREYNESTNDVHMLLNKHGIGPFAGIQGRKQFNNLVPRDIKSDLSPSTTRRGRLFEPLNYNVSQQQLKG